MIYHIALEPDWQAALAVGEYRVSTVGRSLEDEGFIHTSFAGQVRGVADAFYAGVQEQLVLLTIDERRLDVPLQVDVVPGAADGFPHLYGPLSPAAVVLATPLQRDALGRLELPALP